MKKMIVYFDTSLIIYLAISLNVYFYFPENNIRLVYRLPRVDKKVLGKLKDESPRKLLIFDQKCMKLLLRMIRTWL